MAHLIGILQSLGSAGAITNAGRMIERRRCDSQIIDELNTRLAHPANTPNNATLKQRRSAA